MWIATISHLASQRAAKGIAFSQTKLNLEMHQSATWLKTFIPEDISFSDFFGQEKNPS